jgi:hypothetical protein
MSHATDDFETIRRGLTEVWATQGRKFVTFEPSSSRGAGGEGWVQYLDGEVNASWPLEEEPAVALARRGVTLPPGAFVAWHATGSNAVFAMGDASLDDVARFVSALLSRVLADGAGAPLAARVDSHR